MKLLIILFLIAVVTAVPPPSINNAQDSVSLLKYNYENDGTGLYNYAFEQSDGTKQEQHGELRNAGTEIESLFVEGSFTWIGPDGMTYIVRYEAGEEGYNPYIIRYKAGKEGYNTNVAVEQSGTLPAGLLASMIGGG